MLYEQISRSMTNNKIPNSAMLLSFNCNTTLLSVKCPHFIQVITSECKIALPQHPNHIQYAMRKTSCKLNFSSLSINLIILFSTLITNYSLCQEGWKFLDGPYGGIVNAMASTNEIVLISTEGHKLMRSSDNAETWESTNSGIPVNAIITSLIATNDYFLAGTLENGIYKSDNEGRNWSASNQGISNGNSSTIQAFSKEDNKVIVNTNSGVYISVNGGLIWTKINQGLNNIWIYSLCITGNKLIAGGNYSLFISSDLGANWVDKSDNIPFPLMSVTAITAIGDTIIIGVSDSDSGPFYGKSYIYSSNDGGNSWSQTFSFNIENSAVTSLIVNNDTLFASTSTDGIFYSLDMGKSWHGFNNGLSQTSIFGLHSSQSGLYTFGFLDGVYKYDFNSQYWQNKNNNLLVRNISLAKSNSLIYSGSESGIYVTDYSNSYWQNKSKGMDIINIFSEIDFREINDIEVDNDSLIYVASGNNIYSSVDHGANWNKHVLPTLVTSIRKNNDSGVLFAGAGSGVVVSIDSAKTWTNSSNGITGSKMLAFEFIGENIFTVGTGGIFWSFNNGLNWTSLDIPGGGLYKYDIKYYNGYLYLGDLYGIFRSADLGITWTNVWNAGNGFPCSVYSIAEYLNYLVVGTKEYGFLFSQDGINWHTLNEGLPSSVIINEVIAIDSSVYIATDSHGVFKLGYNDLFSCTINDVNILNISDCDTTNGTYTISIEIISSYAVDNTIRIELDSFQFITELSGNLRDTITLTLPVDGSQNVDLTIEFVNNESCSFLIVDAFDVPECVITGNSQMEKLKFTLAPNPVNDILTLYIDPYEMSSFISNCYIYCLNGSKIYSVIRIDGDLSQINIDTSTYPSGLYFLSYQLNGKTHKARFVKL